MDVLPPIIPDSLSTENARPIRLALGEDRRTSVSDSKIDAADTSSFTKIAGTTGKS